MPTVSLRDLITGVFEKRIAVSIDRCHSTIFAKEVTTGKLPLSLHNIQYIVRGSCIRTIGGRQFESKAGSFLWLNPAVPYRFQFLPKTALLYAWVSLATNDGDPVRLPVDITRIDGFTEAAAIMRSLFTFTAVDKDTIREIQRHIAFLSLLIAVEERSHHSKKRVLSAHEIAAVYAVLERTNSLAALLSLGKKFGSSEHAFRRMFRATFGVSARTFALCRRMECAAEDLIADDARVQEIMTRHGYSDPFLFSRMFKRVHGVSPKQYRRRMQR